MISEEKDKSLYGFLFKLPKILEDAFGQKKWYTKQEVDAAADKIGLLNEYILYGHSIYLEERAFHVIYNKACNERNYQELRQELRDYARKYTENISSRPEDIINGVDWSVPFDP